MSDPVTDEVDELIEDPKPSYEDLEQRLEQMRGVLIDAERQSGEWKSLLALAKARIALLEETQPDAAEFLVVKKQLRQAVRDLLELAKDHEALRAVVAKGGGIKVD